MRLQLHTSVVQPLPCRPFLLQAFIRARPAAECPLLPCVRLISFAAPLLPAAPPAAPTLSAVPPWPVQHLFRLCRCPQLQHISPCAAPTIAPSAALTFNTPSLVVIDSLESCGGARREDGRYCRLHHVLPLYSPLLYAALLIILPLRLQRMSLTTRPFLLGVLP